MITGKTSSGFAFEIAEEALDNMELIDAIAEVDENPLAASKVISLMLGKEQRKALYDTLRTDDGRVPVDAMTTALVEIFEAGGKNVKNT